MNRRKLSSYLGAVFGLASATKRRSDASESPVRPESSPPGDIPDNQVFITFTSPDHFMIKVPEGWARSGGETDTVFSDKYNRIVLTRAFASGSFDLAYARSTLVPGIIRTERAASITEIAEVRLRAGRVIKIAFDANSAPNEITDKQIRQENEKFYFVREGQLVILSLTAPKGADNVDQWKLISSSFRWK